MRKSHARLWLCLSVLLGAIVYSGLLFTLKETMDITSWTLYAFTMVSFALFAVQLAFGAGGVKPLPQFDYVNTAVAAIYCIIQLVVFGVLLMLFSGIPFCPIIALETVILAAYLIYMFVWNGAISHAKHQDDSMQTSLISIRLLISDLELIGAQQADECLARRIYEIARDLRFQDVKVAPELASLNTRIVECVAYLKNAEEFGDGNILNAVTKLEALVAERKSKSKAIK